MSCRLLLFSCFFTLVCAEEAQTPAAKRMASLEARAAQTPVLLLSATEYDRYVNKGPRMYQVVVFAAPFKNPQFETIESLFESFKIVALSYESNLKSKRAADPNAKRELVFIAIDTEDYSQVIQWHNLRSPFRLFVLPTVQSKSSEPLTVDFNMIFDVRLSWSEDTLLEWTKRVTKVSFNLDQPLWKLIAPYSLAVVGVVLLLWLLRSVYVNFVGPFHPMFWYWVCVAIWAGCFGGMHFCVLRESQLYVVHPRTNALMFFHPNRNAQFVAEGMIASGSELLAGMLMVMLTLYYPKYDLSPVMKRLVGYTLVAAFFGSVYWVRRLYRIKQGWD